MEKQEDEAERRIRHLEDELRSAELRIEELKAERVESLGFVSKAEEHVKDADALIERWIDAFDLQLGDDGEYKINPGHVVVRFNDLVVEYNELLKKWNAIVPKWNSIVAPKRRDIGRPL